MKNKTNLFVNIIFSIEDRKQIQKLREIGMGYKSISKKTGFSRNAIQRELLKNNPKYNAEEAHKKCVCNYKENNLKKDKIYQ